MLADSFEGCDYVTPDMISSQVIKLNQAFNPSNFNFQLATTDYTNRTLWCGALTLWHMGPHPVRGQSCRHSGAAVLAGLMQSPAFADQ